MKHLTFLALVAVSMVTIANAQVDSSMAKWASYMTPGKEHQWLAEASGTWKGEITIWMSPGAEPEKSTGTTTNTMIMGGRYQQSVHKGNMMGQPFEGQNIIAFDNLKKVFISTWIDNMGTGVMIGEGPWDEKARSVTIKGKMMDPMSGKECDFREVFKMLDKDHQVMEMYVPDPSGKEFKMMEIKYTRTK